jgi:hypothetical protein
MSNKSLNEQFEWLMRSMVEKHECAQENIESEFRRVIRVTVNSCASMYGFSAEEALKRLNSSGEIIELPVVSPIQQKEAGKLAKEAEKLALKEAEKAEKAEKLALKEAEKAEKLRLKEAEKAEKAEKLRLKEAEKALKEAEKRQKVNESSENSAMKEEEVLSKAAEKLRLKEAEKALKEAEKALKKSEKPAKKVKKVKNIKVDDDSDASTVIMSASEDEEPRVLFQNIPLINEINSIRDVKKFKNFKKLSSGVKLARQILDI